ncbi:hypothetical protein [Lacticaseibacillus yichunensis]|uniref:Sortase n=1 Tax=Lacticaseibacillus yichunensis TaxID=2486015 RepID=A0ABW4CRW5_9LACO|nr:hypothetical protein [Lacticaseibacillus yichunensis]
MVNKKQITAAVAALIFVVFGAGCGQQAATSPAATEALVVSAPAPVVPVVNRSGRHQPAVSVPSVRVQKPKARVQASPKPAGTPAKSAAHAPAKQVTTARAETASAKAAPATNREPATPAKPVSKVSAQQAITPAKSTVKKSTVPKSVSGLTMAGQTFAIGTFTGLGHVPGDRVYSWTAVANHYLVEATGVAHDALQQLSIGAPITVNGHLYHLVAIKRHVVNDQAAITTLKTLKAQYGGISLQTCVQTGGSGVSPLDLFFAN